MPRTRTDEVIEQLRLMVSSGQWRPNQRIPPESQLTKSLGVSRGTLREAIKALSHSGMLEVRRGDGTYVRATNNFTGPALRARQNYTEQHILEVRLGLGIQIAQLAAMNASSTDIAVLRAFLVALEKACQEEDCSGWAAAARSFDKQVSLAANNPLLHELYIGLASLFQPATLHDHAQCSELTHHCRGDLLSAIEQHDEVRAASAFRSLFPCCHGRRTRG